MIEPVAGSLHGYLTHSVHLVEVVGGSGVGLIVVGAVAAGGHHSCTVDLRHRSLGCLPCPSFSTFEPKGTESVQNTIANAQSKLEDGII